MNAAGGNSTPSPQRRLVLLGASNLARGIAHALVAAETTWREPLDLLAALGHGRSYGQSSWVLGRTLPGIVECQLWNDLDARRPIPTSAIVTDVGNDILYGASAEKISAWVKKCCERLSHHQSTISITGIPLASLALMRSWEFQIFRSILYPFSQTSFAAALAAASELDERLRELAREFDGRFVEPQQAWYGLDRIHIRRPAQRVAWHEFFGENTRGMDGEISSATLRSFLYVRSLTPYRRWLFGVPHGRRQPSGRLAGGTLVSLY